MVLTIIYWFSGFRGVTESGDVSRRRRVSRAPPNVGKMGNIGDNLRLLHDVSTVSPLEKLAYLSAEKTLDVGLSDSDRWLNSEKAEVQSLVLEHDTWDVTSLPDGRSAIDTK